MSQSSLMLAGDHENRMAAGPAEFVVILDWQPDRTTPARWIYSHALRHKLYIAGVFIGAITNAALAAALPLLIGQAFNAVLHKPLLIDTLQWVALMLVVSQLVRAVLQLGRNFSSEVLSQRLERDIRHELYASLIGKSMTFHDRQPSGDVMARATNDVREINLMFNPGFNLIIGSLTFLVMPLIAAPAIHPQLVLTPVLYLVGYYFSVRAYLRLLNPATERVRREFGAMNARLAETINGIETVKGAAQEEQENRNFLKTVRSWRDAYVLQGDLEARFVPLLLMSVLQAVGLLHSLLLFRAGALGVGQVVAFNGLLLLFGFPTFTAQFAYSQVSSGLSSARRILELVNAETELDQNSQGYAAPARGAVTFEDVTFCYNRADDDCGDGERGVTLEGIDFKVMPGQTVAVVGQTGSGKSTIAKLINRTYDVDSGRVLVDGIDVRDWNMAALRRQISIIEQDIFLFSRSIAENIAFGRPESSRDEIVRAAQAAQAHEFIIGFKDGYDTIIGERGVTLSGGQRQRLALARAFLTDPAILILDDATSAIDSETEDHIQRAIEQAASNRTTFLITHRLSQIRWADLVIVMRKGRVEAVGAHEQLLDDSAAYRDIFVRYEE